MLSLFTIHEKYFFLFLGCTSWGWKCLFWKLCERQWSKSWEGIMQFTVTLFFI